MSIRTLESWFADTDIGKYVAHKEKAFFNQMIQVVNSEVILQGNMFNWHLGVQESPIIINKDVYMNLEYLAFETESVDLILMPHVLEFSSYPERVLAEAYRVLKPEGKLILTGFNPYSLWILKFYFNKIGLPHKSQCLSLPCLKQYIKTAQFSIELGKFMIYVPFVRSTSALQFWRFIEFMGDRWWPHCATVYGLVLLKRQVIVKPLYEYDSIINSNDKMALDLAS